ncbi:MAG: hypothetical protein U9R60_18605, partial [Bacteroidota bacterium]|nr:hypothetical protein [Bacteroidota bacterium]
RISVFFIPFTMNMDKKSPKRDQAVSDEIKPKKKAKGWRKIRWNRNFFKQAGMIFKFIKDILLTFRIKQASINFDTGDFVLNSQLIPALLLVSRKNISLSVNYAAQNSLLLIMQNRLYRIVWRAAIFYYRFRRL